MTLAGLIEFFGYQVNNDISYLWFIFVCVFFVFRMSFEIVRSGLVSDRIWFGRVCVSFVGGVMDFCEILG